MKVHNIHFSFSIFIFSFHHGISLPHEYCLSPLNSSDCNYPPTAVFSYYKSGSRCEIEIWRGCPTYNKFDDEFICSHYCIGKLMGNHDGKPVKEIEFLSDPCAYRMNMKGCMGTMTLEQWQHELEELPEEEIVEIEDILDDVVENIEISAEKVKLLLYITSTQAISSGEEETEAPTEEETEAPAEEETEAPAEEETEAPAEEETEAPAEEEPTTKDDDFSEVITV